MAGTERDLEKSPGSRDKRPAVTRRDSVSTMRSAPYQALRQAAPVECDALYPTTPERFGRSLLRSHADIGLLHSRKPLSRDFPSISSAFSKAIPLTAGRSHSGALTVVSITSGRSVRVGPGQLLAYT